MDFGIIELGEGMVEAPISSTACYIEHVYTWIRSIWNQFHVKEEFHEPN